MPAPGDVVQVSLAFNDATGSLVFNVYTFEIQVFTGTDWQDVADDVETWLEELYFDIVDFMADTVTSSSFTLSLRDKVNAQWNQVHEQPITTINGDSPATQTANQVSAHVNAYSELVRHRGGKYLPPFSNTAVVDGLFTSEVTSALGLFAIDYILTRVGVNTTWLNGIISLSNEQFRRFVGQASFDDRPSAVQSRKAGRGI